jgi:ABC-2 type transport system ATP-binding protein
MILAQNLTKSFGENVAVDLLSFEIKIGETVGLLGPNGAGKTTTINMLVGLLAPDEGRVVIGDDPDQSNPMNVKVRQKIGVAPQSLSLYDELTARENLAFFGGLYNLAGRELRDRINWSLDFAGLQDRKNDRVATYSGGMKRRLNIAVGLIHDPEILLLDEPTVGVDPQSRNHIFESIEQLQKEKMTIIYTTHYMEEAQRLCDRVAIMDHGRLLSMDTVPNLVNEHGGRSVVEAELKQWPDNFDMPGTRDDLSIRFESDDPLSEVAEFSSRGVEFQSLQVKQPDLESVFLVLTGRSLRD